MGGRSIIFKILPSPIKRELKFRGFMKNGFHQEMWGGGIFEENVNTALKDFLLERQLSDKKIVREYVKDIVQSYIEYGVTPQEYFLFDFPNKKKTERSEFLPDQWKDKLSMRATPISLFNKDLTDKYNFYLLNKPYFYREVLKIDDSTDIKTFISFAKKEKVIFIKPIGGSYGIGAFRYAYDEATVNETFARLSKPKARYVAEGLIIQSEVMSGWNVYSVNTVRIPTILNNNGFHVLGCFMRTGREGFVVDNAGAGGILAAVDDVTGQVISDGFDERGKVYKTHPDSNIQFKNFQLPDWSRLLQIAEEAHRGMPEHKYIAYDFAHTNKGWVMVEGNWGQFLSQFASGKGLKKDFFKYMLE